MRSRTLMVTLVLVLIVAAAMPIALVAYARDEPDAPHVVVAPGKDSFHVLSTRGGSRASHVIWDAGFPFFELETVNEHFVTARPGTQVPLGSGTLHVPGADRLRVAFLGDTGTSPDAQRILSQVAAAAPDVIVHLGDVAYADGDEQTWDHWVAMLTTSLPGVPIAYVTGNHDVETTTDSQQIGLFRGSEPHYSFDLGPVHVIVLDSNHVDAAQTAWLSQDLDAATQAGAAWIVPVEHHPWYSSGTVHGGYAPARDADAALFASHGVKLALAGHEHNYERSKPINGTTFIVTGGGGAPLYRDFGPAPDWSATRTMRHEFVLVDFTRTTATGEARAADGSVLDSFTLS